MSTTEPAYYWINQGNQYQNELDAECITAPINNIHHHQRLRDLKEGDIIIHYAQTSIIATSTVKKEAQEKPRTSDPTGENFLIVDVEYNILDKPIPIESIKTIFEDSKEILPRKYSPFNKKLGVNQTYLSLFNKQSFDKIFNADDIVSEKSPKYHQHSKRPHKYWLYSPGEGASKWEEFYELGVMALGWDDLGDLKQYQSKKDITAALQQESGSSGSRKNDSTANDEFANVVSIGDYVIVKKGKSQLLGLGQVASAYYYDDSASSFKSRRNVKWLKKGEWDSDHELVLKTLTDVSSYKDEEAGFEYYYERLLALMDETAPKPSKPMEPLNQILYGPPGTGKTYNTIDLAVKIAAPNRHIQNDRRANQKLFDDLIKEEQIVFTTFHQSLSYEDFIEGIKPLKPLPAEKFLKYDIQDGIFKSVCERARSNFENAKSGNQKKIPFELALEKLKDDLEENPEMKFPLRTPGYDFTILGFTSTSIQFKKASGGTGHTLSLKTLKNLYYGQEYNFKEGVGIYYPPILDKLKSYDSAQEEAVELKNFVLIIDEINRGNVSQIFGELITLIEDDKREDMPNALSVTLPYSKESFSVPPNLHIIGTMNTADRSVEALDTALRRRFTFKEMMPKPEVIVDVLGEENQWNRLYISEILKTINERIEILVDRDHTIGHSYFLDLANHANFDNALKRVFTDKIIPLLQEYFFNDYVKIAMVLGDGFISITDNQNLKFANVPNSIEGNFDDIVSYRILPFEEIDIEKALFKLMNQANNEGT